MMKRLVFLIFFLFSFSAFATPWSSRAFETAENGTYKEIRKAVETDYNFTKYKDSQKKTVLMAALEKSRANDVIKLLLDSGSSPDAKDKSGKTVLMYACQNESDMDAIRTVIEYDAFLKSTKAKRILKTDKEGKNSFDYAAENPQKDEVIALLCEYAKNPNDIEEEPEPEIQEEPPEEPAEEVPEIAEEIPPVEEVSPLPEETPPVVAVVAPPVEIPQVEDATEIPENELLELDKMAGPAVAIESIYLYDYAQNPAVSTKIPASLLKSSANFTFIENADEKDENGVTLLMKAAKKGDVEKIRNLIYSGADVNAKDKEGWTALMYAVRYQNDADVVKILLNNKASPLVKNIYDANAMMIGAAFSKNPEIVKLLIESYSATSQNVRSAFVYGIKNSAHAENLKPFIDKGLRLNIPYDGKTYLMYACESNKDTDIIALLLENGADKSQNINGKTAFSYAKENSKLKHDAVYWSLSTY